MEHKPISIKKYNLEVILEDILKGLREDDTLEGNISFIINPDNHEEWLVSGMYRIGNKLGQGGYRMIGSFE